MTVRRAMLLIAAGCFFSCATAQPTKPQNATKTKEASKTSDEHAGEVRALGKNKHSPGPVIPPKAHHQQPVPAHSDDSEAIKNAHAPVIGKSSHTTSRGIASNRPETAAAASRSLRQSTVNRPVVAAREIRHRGANPAMVGGPIRNHPEHTAALSGNHWGRGL